MRPKMLPWRNLRTGTYTYHGCDELVKEASSNKPDPPPKPDPNCGCNCCKAQKMRKVEKKLDVMSASTQTDDINCPDPESYRDERKVHLHGLMCRLCFERNQTGYQPLFRNNTGPTTDPILIKRIYVATGLMLTPKHDPGAQICFPCREMVNQSYQFRIRTRSMNLKFKHFFMKPYVDHNVQKKKEEEEKPKEVEQVLLKTETYQEQQSIDVELKDVKQEPEPELEQKPEPGLLVEVEMKVEPADVPEQSEPIPVDKIKLESGTSHARDHPSTPSSTDLCNLLAGSSNKRVRVVNFEEFKTIMDKVKIIKKES